MKIHSIGYAFIHGRNFKLERPQGLNEYLFLIIRSTAIFHINGESLHIMPNSMLLIKKHTPHSFSADSNLFVNDWVSFDLTEQECMLLSHSNIVLNTFFTSPEVDFCSKLLMLMQEENILQTQYSECNILHLIQIIFNKLSEASKCSYPQKPYYNELRKIRDRILAHPTEKYTIKNLSAEINLSESYFQHCYKACFNSTPIADAIISRIEYSKQLLRSTDFSVAKIAEITGYRDDVGFIKQFKAVSGTTPNKYRNIITDT